MKYPKIKVVWDRRKEAHTIVDKEISISDELAEKPVEIRVYGNKNTKYKKTGITVQAKHWNFEGLPYIQRHPNRKLLNDRISKRVKLIENILDNMDEEGLHFTHKELDKRLGKHDHGGEQSQYFLEWARKQINTRYISKVEDEQITEDTKKHHHGAMNRFQEFLVKEHGQEDILPNQITLEVIKAYDEYLNDYTFEKPKGVVHKLGGPRKHKLMDNLYTYLKRAKKSLEVKTWNWFGEFKWGKYKPPRGRSTKFIHPSYFRDLENWNVKAFPELEEIYDRFMFCCYTGLRYQSSEQLYLHLFREHGEEVWFTHQPPKTEKTSQAVVNLPLHQLFNGKALEIYKKYNHRDPIFPPLANQYINRTLKEIQEKAGIPTNLTTHVARHTFGTNLVNLHVPKQTIMKLMGITEEVTVNVYSDLLNQTLEEDLAKAFGEEEHIRVNRDELEGVLKMIERRMVVSGDQTSMPTALWDNLKLVLKGS